MTPNSRIVVIAVALFATACASAPNASSEAIAACKGARRPYTGDQPPPGYPDARRGTGARGNEWYVPSTVQKGRWGVLCVAD
jgi:hypothetical protein